MLFEAGFTGECPGFIKGIEYHGYKSIAPITNFPGGAGECSIACKGFPGCSYFTYIKKDKTCKLYHTAVNSTINQEAISGTQDCGSKGKITIFSSNICYPPFLLSKYF